MAQLGGLVDAGNTVVIMDHEMRVVAIGGWVIDMGPGAGPEGGRIVASGTPAQVASSHPKEVSQRRLRRPHGHTPDSGRGVLVIRGPSELPSGVDVGLGGHRRSAAFLRWPVAPTGR